MKRLQSSSETVFIKHGHLESKTKLLGVITQTINETNNLFSFRNTAANTLDYLPQSVDVRALNLCSSGCCAWEVHSKVLQKGSTFTEGCSLISDIRSHEMVNKNYTALLECSTFGCRPLPEPCLLHKACREENPNIFYPCFSGIKLKGLPNCELLPHNKNQ